MEGLKSPEQEAREIVDAIPQTIAVLSPDGQPLYGNRSLLQYTGLTIAEMTSAEFRARVFHPDDVARLREERRDALARGVPFELEQRARRHDGHYRWFLVQYNPAPSQRRRSLPCPRLKFLSLRTCSGVGFPKMLT
jgi:PAS domain S-box-containing protein